jgi:hypothetical protein
MVVHYKLIQNWLNPPLIQPIQVSGPRRIGANSIATSPLHTKTQGIYFNYQADFDNLIFPNLNLDQYLNMLIHTLPSLPELYGCYSKCYSYLVFGAN